MKKKNKIVLFYIDGNTGLKKDSSDFSINFLGKDAYVRRGIAYLSQKFENNIIPVVNTRNKWIGSEFKFLKTIRPTKKVNFVKDTTQYLYKILEDFLDNHPEQWEGWLYINKFFDDPYIKTTKYKLNNGLEIKQSNDKNYLVYNELLKKPISNELYSILDYINDKNGIKFKDIRIGNHLYTKKSIMDLVKKQVII